MPDSVRKRQSTHSTHPHTGINFEFITASAALKVTRLHIWVNRRAGNKITNKIIWLLLRFFFFIWVHARIQKIQLVRLAVVTIKRRSNQIILFVMLSKFPASAPPRCTQISWCSLVMPESGFYFTLITGNPSFHFILFFSWKPLSALPFHFSS